MQITRCFTIADRPVVDQIEWKRVDVGIPGSGFFMAGVEVPKCYSQNAANIMASKYFRKRGVGKELIRDIDSRSYAPEWLRPSTPKQGTDSIGETSAKQVFHRLAGHWTYIGYVNGYFGDTHPRVRSPEVERNAQAFYDEIYWMLANQYAAPNSPQFFNTGLWWAYGIEGDQAGLWTTYENGTPKICSNSYEYPQVHACFINDLKDNLVEENGIYDLLSREARIFKFGSGAGSNFSVLRAKGEPLSGGGKSSGLMSWLEIFDRSAGSIHSGGTTRRAAKMVIVDADHPDILEFVNWKVGEEYKAAAMYVGSQDIRDAYLGNKSFNDPMTDYPQPIIDRANNGFEPDYLNASWEGEAIRTVSAQNANNSVRFKDKFFKVLDGKEPYEGLEYGVWPLHMRTTGAVSKYIKAQDLWTSVCRAAWACADPGLQFHDTINKWHTCKADGEIVASNPCSEYMFLNDTACNLASLNLDQFRTDDGGENGSGNGFAVKSFAHAASLWTIVLDISAQMAGSPSPEIAKGNYNYRTLGLGYCSVAKLLLNLGLAYDSNEARALIGAITSLMTATAYSTSATLASELGPFPRWEANEASMRNVINLHIRENDLIPAGGLAGTIIVEAGKLWKVCQNHSSCGFRNAQTTLIAPTGTISLIMDATSGIEPLFALAVDKDLAGGGSMDLMDEALITEILERLKYDPLDQRDILDYIRVHGEVHSFDRMALAHRDLFLCAVPPSGPALPPEAHVKMVAAIQPFLSGAASKTVNMPADSTIADVDRIYRMSHKMGLKAVALYRDGSKLTQPLKARGKKTEAETETQKETSHDLGTTVGNSSGGHSNCVDLARGGVVDPKKFKELFAEAMKKSNISTHVHVIAHNSNGELKPNGRKKLPPKRKGYTQKVNIDGQSIYLKTGEYEDGTLGEIFLSLSRTGSTLRALGDGFAIAISIGLQHGVPLETYLKSFQNTRFEPAGLVLDHDNIKMCTSIFDFVFRDLAISYLGRMDLANEGSDPMPEAAAPLARGLPLAAFRPSGETCGECGSLNVIIAGTCKLCKSCGWTTGCG